MFSYHISTCFERRTFFSMIRYNIYFSINMNKFKLIDWNVPLENLIDDVFIKDERMQKDSAMYQIMNGTFQDPFINIENDYIEINSQVLENFYENVCDLDEDNDEINGIKNEDKEEFQIKQKSEKEQHKPNTEKLQKREKINNKKPYIPGMKKLPFYFPRKSSLNSDQQAMCTRVLLQMFSGQKVPTSTKEKAELENYMTLQKVITTEQREFQKFSEKIWDENASWCIKHNVYIELKWGKQLFELKKLPRYYVESSNVPFSSNKNITVKFVSYLQQGTISEVILPKFDKPYFLEVDSTILFRKYPPSLSSLLPIFKLPVSEDTYCVSLAEETKVDLVISSSGLKCILNNISSDCSNSWTIPVIIKSHNGKNVIYVDKKLPSVAATASQKNAWVYKYILRHCLVATEVKSSEGRVPTEKDEPIAKVHQKLDEISDSLQNHDKINLLEKDLSSSMNTQQNVTYKLFTLGPAESKELRNRQCKLMKDVPKEYQILVRTKTDYIEMLPDGQSQFLMLAPKMEHQLSFGAEAATLEEGLQQWVSLVFRPDTLLARVRIAAESGEVIQVEKHTTMSLSTEMKRLYNVKVEDSLIILHNIIERLSCLTPGRYILRYIEQYGPFAYIYKSVEECEKNNFDLHSLYESQTFKTIPVTPWPHIDTMLMTPSHKYYNKMPAMFNPKTSRSSDVTSGVEQRATNQNISEQTGPHFT